MKPLKRKLTSSFALFVLLSATQLASAFYDPSLGRWLNRDPIGEAGFEILRNYEANSLGDGPNVYAFVRNAPLSRIDAFGLVSLTAVCICVVVVDLSFECDFYCACVGSDGNAYTKNFHDTSSLRCCLYSYLCNKGCVLPGLTP